MVKANEISSSQIVTVQARRRKRVRQGALHHRRAYRARQRAKEKRLQSQKHQQRRKQLKTAKDDKKSNSGKDVIAIPLPLRKTGLTSPWINTKPTDSESAHGRPTQTSDNRGHGGRPDPGRPDGHSDDHRPNHNKHDSRPGYKLPERHAVCLGGRTRNGSCRCRRADTLRRIRRGLFACATSGGIAVIPGVPAVAARIALAADPQSSSETPSEGANPARPPVLANPPSPFAPDQVLVSLSPGTPETVDDDVAQIYGLEVINRWPLDLIGVRLVLYRIPDGRTVDNIVSQLRGDGRITAPQPNYYYIRQAEQFAENKQADDLQYALANMKIAPAHEIATGKDVVIAIIDTKIDTTHPDLLNAVQETYNAVDDQTSEADDHGTAIAGIIGARGILKGIAPDARLLGINAFLNSGQNGGMTATTATLLRGLDWAVREQANIINLSFAGPSDDLVRKAIAAVIDAGAIPIAAAGNGGERASPAYPAAYPGVIAVTAVDIQDRIYPLANRGSYIEIAAPGVDVLTLALDHAHLLQSGTSFAAAHISALAALMIEQDPALTLDTIRVALTEAAEDLGSPGRDNLFGAGKANAVKALKLVQSSRFAGRSASQAFRRP